MSQLLLFDDSLRRRARIGGGETLTKRDARDLNEAAQRIYELMRDGRFHTREEIERASGQLEGMRRMRELRLLGKIEKRPIPGAKRAWTYRLVLPCR
jgi:hypothetical protein